VLGQAYSRATYVTGLWAGVYFATRLLRRQPLLVVFTFHRVTADDNRVEHLVTYDRGISAAVFDIQLREIKKRFEVISLDEFSAVVDSGQGPRRASCLLTFDDADSEFISAALPVLQRHECPAVVFAPTDYIGTDRRFWHLRVSNAFQKADQNMWPEILKLAECFSPERRHWLDDLRLDQRALGCWRFNLGLDALPDDEIDGVLRKLEAITGPEYDLGIKCMDWAQLRTLEQSGIAVESHAVSHRKLARLALAEVGDELAQSKIIIESKLGKKVRAVCYPAGSHNDRVARSAMEVGYQLGFTTRVGAVGYPVASPEQMTLKRFDMRGTDRYEAARFLGGLALR
jgi:peptidoglycan/xylan/chitin deacetylase (PgdA/CDA1 family)